MELFGRGIKYYQYEPVHKYIHKYNQYINVKYEHHDNEFKHHNIEYQYINDVIMKLIINTDSHDIESSYKGFTYTLPKDKPVFVNDDLYAFLKGQLPMSFNFKAKVGKDTVVPKVSSVKTRAFMQTQELGQDLGTEDMKIENPKPVPTFVPDAMPQSGTTDRDGVGWYGGGVEPDTL